ncbi:MAG: ThuA domain-containing protein [Clostridia bacterium]|nr:ThuA domain-containing protein [Clostridia bacterium]
MIRVTVWNENIHDQKDEVKAVYPLGIHGTIAAFLSKDPELEVRTATLDQPACGLPDDVLQNTDVLFWWGHIAHGKVPDELAVKAADRVRQGMGLVMLHSGHESKLFKMLMGTTCSLRWRDPDFERLWCIDPSHPLTSGVPAMFELPVEEMYGEAFDIPHPDSVVYGGWFRGGELFRSVCTFTRGAGKIVYFQPGHETFPTYHNEHVQTILTNAAHFTAPVRYRTTLGCFHSEMTTEERYEKGIPFDMMY